jgi:hypothetical protein
MPAPARPAPVKVIPDSTRFANGIVGVYSDAEIDALLANLPGGSGGSAVTVHDEPTPQPASPTPQGVEDSFAAYPDGLHYFQKSGALVSIVRSQFQTDIVVNGSLRSVAKVVKSEAGLPTPQNPSTLLNSAPDGKWMLVASDELDKPFGPPQMVDLFALTGGGADLTNYFNKPEVDAKLALKADTNNPTQIVTARIFQARGVAFESILGESKTGSTSLADLGQGQGHRLGVSFDGKAPTQLAWTTDLDAKADQSDTYTKKEVDDKLEADKDFSIANDNVLLASLTSLQGIVSNLGSEIGTGQIDVLDAIRDVEIEPSAIKFTESVTSPIKWKGGLSLAPTKEGDTYHLAWSNGKDVGNLLTSADLSDYALLDSYGQVITASQMKAETFVFTKANTTIGYTRFPDYPDGRLGIQINGPSGEVQIIAYVSDLSGYAKKQDNTQNVVVNAMVAKGYAFGDAASPSNPGLVYTDTGEGYGPRLALDTPGGVELIPYQSDFEPIKARLNTLEGKQAPVTDLSPYVTQVDADAKYELKASGDLLRSQTQAIFDSIYTRAESDARYAAKGTTYTQAECDSKFLTIVDTNQFAYQADVYTQKQVDDRFMQIDQAFSKADFDNQMALFLYSRKQVDDRLAAINPLGSPSINNPALADFKKSVLDEVKLMLVGGTKMPPPDIDWTWMVRMDGSRESVSTEIQARMIGGFIELKGTLAFGAGSGSWVPLRLPPQFPVAEVDASYPLAMRLVGTAVTYGFCSVSSKSRDISCSPGAKSSEANFSGIRFKAAY